MTNKNINYWDCSKQRTFLHILWHDDLKFLPQLVPFLQRENNHLYPDEHVFVTPFIRVYTAIKQCKHAYYVVGASDADLVKLVNNDTKNSKWIFLHGAVRKSAFMRFGSSSLKKMIYRSWGGDLVFDGRSQQGIKQKLKHRFCSLANPLLIKHYRMLRAIGIANIVDKMYIEDHIGLVETPVLGYCAEEPCLSELVPNPMQHNNRDGSPHRNVMVGHAGVSADNHRKIINELQKFVKNDITVYIILSYGDIQYINCISDYARAVLKDRVVILKEMLPLPDYIKLLSKIDIAILDDVHSSALGNLSWLITFEKTLYINSRSLYRKALDRCGLPYKLTDMLSACDYNSFSTLLHYRNPGAESELAVRSYAWYVREWRRVLDGLKQDC